MDVRCARLTGRMFVVSSTVQTIFVALAQARRVVLRRPAMLWFAPQVVLLYGMVLRAAQLLVRHRDDGLIEACLTAMATCALLAAASAVRNDEPFAFADLHRAIRFLPVVTMIGAVVLAPAAVFATTRASGRLWIAAMLVVPFFESAVTHAHIAQPFDIVLGAMERLRRSWRTWLLGQLPVLVLVGLGELTAEAVRRMPFFVPLPGIVMIQLLLPEAVGSLFLATAFVYRVELAERLT
jgi:hypothetical protein